MSMILQRNVNYVFSATPFSGRGVSIYAGTPPLRYRNMTILQRKIVLQKRTLFPVTKTSRVASQAGSAGDAITPAVDLSAFAGQTIAVDVRHYADNVENQASHPRLITLDGSGDVVTEIRGVAVELNHEVRAGGIVRIRFRWIPSPDGTQPDLFRIARTAGPTSPADVTTAVRSARNGAGIYEIDTPALSDASAYTYKVQAENTAGTVTKDLLTGISITADATGPTAPGSLSITAV